MAILGRRGATIVVLSVLFFLLGVGAASADPVENKNDYQNAYDKCMAEQNMTEEGSAARRIADALPDAVSDNTKKVFCADQAASAHPGDAVATAAGAVGSKFWGDPVGKFVKALMEGNAQTLQTVMTFWMDFSTAQTKNVDANVQGVKNIVAGLAATALIASFIIGGYRIAASRRMGLQDGMEETAGVVVKYIIFSFAVVATVPSALVASDALADSIMKNFGVTDANQVVEMAALSEGMAGPIIIMVLAIVSLLGAIVQLIALVTRVLILPIAVGLTPLAAASSFSETGRSMLNSLMAFMIACVAYKPLAALLYAVVMWNATQPGDNDLISAAINVLMIALAGFCAPALIRVIAPMTAAAGGGGAAPLMSAAGAGASAALGMGAMMAGGAGKVLAGSAAKGAAAGGGGSGSPSGGGSTPGAPIGGGGGGGRAGAPSTEASPSGSSGSAGGAAPGGGSSSRSGASGAVSTAATPTGAGGSGSGGANSAQPARTRANTSFGQRVGNGLAGAGRVAARGASVAERIGALGLSGASHTMRAGARTAQAGGTAANHTQRILDDSIGVNGYAGGRHQ